MVVNARQMAFYANFSASAGARYLGKAHTFFFPTMNRVPLAAALRLASSDAFLSA